MKAAAATSRPPVTRRTGLQFYIATTNGGDAYMFIKYSVVRIQINCILVRKGIQRFD
jgi:hypothetical protein